MVQSECEQHIAHAWAQVAYSLLAVSPDRHLEYIRCMTGSEPLANGTSLRFSPSHSDSVVRSPV